MADQLDKRLARRMRVRLAGEKRHQQPWYVAFGPHYIPRHFFAGVDDPRYPKCELEIRVVDGKPICVGLRLEEEELTRTVLRKLPPLVLLVRQAAAAVERDEHPHPAKPVPPQTVTRADYSKRYDAYPKHAYRPGQRIDDQHLEWIAEIYRRALERRENPVAAIAREVPTSRSTAGRWVMVARQRGHLGRALGERQAGERPKPKRRKDG
jgi:hypothetical protein